MAQITNNVKQRWQQEKPVINAWLSAANTLTAEAMSTLGFDTITVDLQHGVIDYAQAVVMIQALRIRNVTPMARVPWLEPGIIMKLLDAGALGIICPMVNTRAQAAEFVQHMRYPPKGTRSFGPTVANLAYGGDYSTHANDTVLALAMIETQEAMDNLEDIVSTPGLDGVYIGPADLALGVSNGALKPGFDRTEPQLQDAIRKIVDSAHKASIRAGLHCGKPEYAAMAVREWGLDLVTLATDVRFMSEAGTNNLNAVRSLLNDTTQTQNNKPSTSGY